MNVTNVSVITLTYKNWRILDKAIASVANQIVDENYKIEYLIVDDGSDDFDVDYVSSLLTNTKLKYRIIINPNNYGTVASFNNAIRQSTGDIIIPLSADDEFYDSNVVNDIANEFVNTDAKIVTGYRVLKSNGFEFDCFPKAKVINLFDNREKLLKYLLCRGNIVSGASTYYSRRVFDKIGFFDEKYKLLEDYPFYIKSLSNGLCIHFFERKVIFFGDEGVSSKKNINPILLRDYETLFSSIVECSDLNFFERRFVLYSKMKTTKQKYMQSWLYPEQFICFIVVKLARLTFNSIRTITWSK